MSGKRYTDEFKIEAVKQVTERGHSVADVAQRLGITTHSLYAWKPKFGRPDVVRQSELDLNAEVRRQKAELKRAPSSGPQLPLAGEPTPSAPGSQAWCLRQSAGPHDQP
ncbi:transposase IS3/IS911 family protein [Burkholderia contaminans]|uniref:Transposase IS3/IS911 family protein n=1 Tax=Burkholderia contaminans TaxID=488447 RepID=A0A6P3BY46_9BURK|nr:transposase IS3/IS911 family protein [Burkholderia contaminans]